MPCHLTVLTLGSELRRNPCTGQCGNDFEGHHPSLTQAASSWDVALMQLAVALLRQMWKADFHLE